MLGAGGRRVFRRCGYFAVAACVPLALAAALAPADQAALDASMNATPAFNRYASVIFGLAIVHTFLASQLMRLSHRFEREHRERLVRTGEAADLAEAASDQAPVSFKAEMFHFLGEIEVVFGLWVLPLLVGMTYFHGWERSVHHLNSLNFTEPLFVLVIMSIAASRPVMVFAQGVMGVLAAIGRYSVGAWWLAILTLGPLLGSFITEPAAMTVSALLLARKFYDRFPSKTLAYATLGLLFVNVSIGGTLTHFAAPPVLMVAGKWGWDMPYMFVHFGWKAALAVVMSNGLFWIVFRKEFARMNRHQPAVDEEKTFRQRVPKRIVFVHVLFLAWTVANNHYPVLFLGGFLFFIGFTQATAHYQDALSLRGPLLVAFFLAGLVIHGSLQSWWIRPLLASMGSTSLFWGATFLTAFNDNAAITYLASLVPNLTETLKYAVVAGAVTGGGLTVIANAPNPAGVSILGKFFDDSVSPAGLAVGALIPTLIAAACFLLL
jgi:hypothetical protein